MNTGTRCGRYKADISLKRHSELRSSSDCSQHETCTNTRQRMPAQLSVCHLAYSNEDTRANSLHKLLISSSVERQAPLPKLEYKS
jgi:hypothetical protein